MDYQNAVCARCRIWMGVCVMVQKIEFFFLRLGRRLSLILGGPPALAFLPALCLGAFWIGGEGALLVCAALMPVVYLMLGGLRSDASAILAAADATAGLLPQDMFEGAVSRVFARADELGQKTATFTLAIEDFDQLRERYGDAAVDRVLARTGERLIAALRDRDSVGTFGDGRFGVCIDPVRHLDLELCIQMAGRLQRSVEDPISLDGTVIYVSVSVGFCHNTRTPQHDAMAWLGAARTALSEAVRHGPSAIRAFSGQMAPQLQASQAIVDDVAHALETGQIAPWFQPQVSTGTGEISGFEALARWSHPTRGVLMPADFLPALEQADLLERLAELMMYHSFAALSAWDAAGVRIPRIGVNFAGTELSNPRLVEKISWELDRFELTPDRLGIEILETVVANAPDDMITRNITALGQLGCRIDLDDFGTGHASIASIRRFAVNRIKIDRSFVMKADRDPGQQRMIGAILTMAERLGVETLAEGVETVGEHVILAQLGCDHVQGFGIARPMPVEQTLNWIAAHDAKLCEMPRIIGGNG